MFSNLQNFEALRYFEFSIYNETVDPSMSCEEIMAILRILPKDIKEVCIYTSDECKNISEFIRPEISSKFEYLELGFSQLKLPVDAKHVIEVANKFPNRGDSTHTSLTQLQFKNELLEAITIGQKANRYSITHGPSSSNQFGYHWFELKDLKKKVDGRQSKSEFRSVRRN